MIASMTYYIPEYEEHLSFLSLAPSSIKEMKRDLLIVSKYLPSPVRQITRADLERAFSQMKKERSIKEVTLNRKITFCRLFFAFLLERGHISENPAEELSFAKRIKGTPVHLSKDHMQKLLQASAANLIHNTIIHTYYETGIRLSELIKFQVPDVDSSAMKIRVMGKGARLVMSPSARSSLGS